MPLWGASASGSRPRRRQPVSRRICSAGVYACALAVALTAQPQPSIVNAVRARLVQHDLAGAESLARAWQAKAGPQPQLAAAYSWLARAALGAKSLDRADALAAETRTMAEPFLKGRKLDDDPWLP